MLRLRRGTVVEAEPLTVEVAGERRRAWADVGMVGECVVGDEVVVNTAALDLGLGSGGFDVVHVNLTRGLEGGKLPAGVHVFKLNYSSLQHAVDPAEAPTDAPARPERPMPVLVLPLHGHLAPAAWALAEARPDAKVGFVQTAGAALPGSLSRDVKELRSRGLLVESVTAGPSYGGDAEAISTVGALHAAALERGWDAAIAGPGPGILGSDTRYGHGGMAALDSAHAALGLGLPTLLSPRLSMGDPRPRHRGLSHHTASVLELLLAEVAVAVPEGEEGLLEGDPAARHRVVSAVSDLAGYGASGLPRRSMGRDLEEDPLFFAAPLAAGTALAGMLDPS